MRFDLQGKMVKDAGDLGEVVYGVDGSKPTTLPQGVAERSGLLGVRDQDLPSHGPLLEGLSPQQLRCGVEDATPRGGS